MPRNDPTLMFTNAGMVQFKNVFTGQEKRPYVRATTAQKCVRAGGKHNDLDNVGYTARHHTFFEMLGNFSFGDYFKEQAIPYAWELVTKDYGLPKDRLLVTVFSEDDDAAAIWKQGRRLCRTTGSSASRPTDNFWRMGDTGPCGPCSRDLLRPRAGDSRRPARHRRMRTATASSRSGTWCSCSSRKARPARACALPRPSIDTGMGLERVAAILQGKHDNYDTDTFRALILASAEATGQDPDGPHRVSHRVVADHLRSAAFLIADGVLPSNEGRGYVLRRIMRRAMRHAHDDGRAGAGDVSAGAGAGAPDGRRLSRAGARRGADRRDAAAGGDALPPDCWSAACICWPRRPRGWATASRCPARWRSGCTTRSASRST